MAIEPFLKFEEINPDTAAKKTLIWLHGLGADGNDFVPMATQLNINNQLGLRFIFPHAPVQRVTLNMGMEMPSWYDIYGLAEDSPQDNQGVVQAQGWINELIKRENERGISTDKIIIGGFSQGGALALATALQHPQALAGAAVLSCYLPIAEQILLNLAPANQALPIFIAHGRQDNVVQYDWGKQTHNYLRNHHYPVEWHDYPMAHTTCAEEIKAMAIWLTA
ncbi:MAG: carboxylesterase [Gammaproteobacteria bacterium]|nr:carboxylesterase [Gammaproteobacteria bacterium]